MQATGDDADGCKKCMLVLVTNIVEHPVAL